jgi:hypothetical protein
VGKILRIVPDLSEHTATSTVSANGRYRVPHDNPFTGLAGARAEIWALGLRNPHRLTWDVAPDGPDGGRLIAASIGLYAWETVNVIRRGANYGYSLREGNMLLQPNNTLGPLPTPDRIPVRISGTVTAGETTTTYPVAQYPHDDTGGDAIAGGFVYRGQAIPELQGKYVLGDITTGRLWYIDVADLVAADDGIAETMAELRPVRVQWNDPDDAPDAGPATYPSMFPIAMEAYHARGGQDPDLPGQATVSGPARADIRLAVDAAGELYILSKTDGMIRAVVGASVD